MSIMAGGMRQMMGLLDKLSISQIQQGMKLGRFPAYLAIPAIELKTRMQKQFEQQKALQQPSPKEMPTVAEQVMQEAQGMGSLMGAEMNSGAGGVEQLPSNLPQNYAEGGIVAFEDGGMVDHYAGGGVVALSKGGDPLAEAIMDDLIRQQQLDKIRAARDAAKAAAEAAKTAGPGAAAAEAAAQTASQAASGPSRFESIRRGMQPKMFNPDIRLPSMEGGSGILKGGARLAGKFAGPLALADLVSTGVDVANLDTDAAREYYGMQLKPGEEPSFLGDVGVRSRAALGMLNPFGNTQAGIAAIAEKRRQAEAAAAAGQGAPKDEGAGGAGTGGPGAGPGAGGTGVGAGAGAGAEGSSFGDLFSQIQRAVATERAKIKTPTSIFETERPKFEAEEAKIADERKAERERLMGTVPGQAYERLEKDLLKEAEGMGVEREQAKNMAIFKAGLAMMAGTSRYALQNIGAGAMVGAEDWQKAAADMKKAQKENQRMLAHIEQARRAEKIGDRDKQIAEMDKALDRRAARNQFMFTSAINAGVRTEEQAVDLLGKSIVGATSMYGSDAKMAATLARIAGGAGAPKLSASDMMKIEDRFLGKTNEPKMRGEFFVSKTQGKGDPRNAPKPGQNTDFDKQFEEYRRKKMVEFITDMQNTRSGNFGAFGAPTGQQQQAGRPPFEYLGRE